MDELAELIERTEHEAEAAEAELHARKRSAVEDSPELQRLRAENELLAREVEELGGEVSSLQARAIDLETPSHSRSLTGEARHAAHLLAVLGFVAMASIGVGGLVKATPLLGVVPLAVLIMGGLLTGLRLAR